MGKQNFWTCGIPSKWPRKMRTFFGPECFITISSCRNSGKLSALSYAQDSRLFPSCDSKAAAWTHYWIAKSENKRKITQKKNCRRRRRCKGNTSVKKSVGQHLLLCLHLTRDRIKIGINVSILKLNCIFGSCLNPVMIFLSFPSPRWFASVHALDLLHEDLSYISSWAYF